MWRFTKRLAKENRQKKKEEQDHETSSVKSHKPANTNRYRGLYHAFQTNKNGLRVSP